MPYRDLNDMAAFQRTVGARLPESYRMALAVGRRLRRPEGPRDLHVHVHVPRERQPGEPPENFCHERDLTTWFEEDFNYATEVKGRRLHPGGEIVIPLHPRDWPFKTTFLYAVTKAFTPYAVVLVNMHQPEFMLAVIMNDVDETDLSVRRIPDHDPAREGLEYDCLEAPKSYLIPYIEYERRLVADLKARTPIRHIDTRQLVG